MKAFLVNRMEDWEFSSFREYCGMDDGNLCNKQKLRNLLRLEEDDNFYDFSYSSLTEDDLVIR